MIEEAKDLRKFPPVRSRQRNYRLRPIEFLIERWHCFSFRRCLNEDVRSKFTSCFLSPSTGRGMKITWLLSGKPCRSFVPAEDKKKLR